MRLLPHKFPPSAASFPRRASASGADAWVRVKGGYHPDTITAGRGSRCGSPFRREEALPCSARVVFPDFGVTADLPQRPGRDGRAAARGSGRVRLHLRGTAMLRWTAHRHAGGAGAGRRGVSAGETRPGRGVNKGVLDQLNAVHDDLEDAMQTGDQERFSRELIRLLALVRDAGERLDADHLAPSELILPPEDISLAEIAGELSTDRLIPV